MKRYSQYLLILAASGSGPILAMQPQSNPNQNPVVAPLKGFAALSGIVPEELVDFVDALKDNNGSFAKYSVKLPSGILLVGQTGCGKTRIAKSLSEEVDCPYIYQTASDLGDADAIKGLFESARKKAKNHASGKAILFIDDFDSLGSKKSSADVNALLNEMDGFKGDNSVIVIAASDKDQYDKSLVRSGRFEKVIEVPLPNEAQRQTLLKAFNQASKIPFDRTLNMAAVAKATYNFTPADLKAVIEHAHLIAKKSASQTITERTLLEAIVKVLQAKSRNDKAIILRLRVLINALNQKKNEKRGFARLVGDVPEEITSLVKQIKNDTEYRKYNLELPKGILLSGPPGTGKTSLVRALSEEAGCEFIAISAGEFAGALVGSGAQKIRDLFKEAREKALESESKKTIIFIDELDSIGKRQGNSLDSTITELLTQMDGFEEDSSVIVIAASNHPKNIDPALLRPGRFNKIIKVGLPDVIKREQILKMYAGNVPVASDVNLKKIAEATNNFSPADLKELVQKAAALALKENIKELQLRHFVEAIRKMLNERLIKGDKDIQQQLDALDVLFNGKESNKGFKRIVGGIDPAIEDLVKMLKGEYNYSAFGIPFPKGVLLAGPPGTGKTALVRAIAEETGCEFVQAKGSDFIEKYVGVGAQRVRDLFNDARTKAEGNRFGKTIIFIDEIDAVGSRTTSDNSETQRTVTELLTQMDGFYKDESVIVIAATNAPALLDPALMRAGRFDTMIEIALPNFEKRKALFAHYIKGKPMDPNIDFDALAKAMEGCNAADIKNLVDKAAQLAMRARQTRVTQANFDQALAAIKSAEDQKKNTYISPKR